MKNNCFCLFIIFVACSISACKQSSNTKIKNGIELHEHGLHVTDAFLTNANSYMIDNSNKVHAGERVCLRMIVKGWSEKEGKVFLDASQKVTTSAGAMLTYNASILGAAFMFGVTPKDAEQILLYQPIGRLDKPVDYVLISFKVWDKTNNNSVSGSYKVHIE